MEHISEYLKQVNDLLNKHKKDEETHVSATDIDQYQDDISVISESIGEQNENQKLGKVPTFQGQKTAMDKIVQRYPG